jgi:hypothetical protein
VFLFVYKNIGAATHSLLAGKVENSPCLQIKKEKGLFDILVSYFDNSVGIKITKYINTLTYPA